MSTPLIFARDGRTLPFIPVTTAAVDAIRELCHVPRDGGERRSYPHALAVYMALLELANEARADRVAVTQRSLAEKAVASRSAIQAALNDLQAAGVVVKREQAHGRARIENEYIVVEPEPQPGEPADAAEMQQTAPPPFPQAGVAREKSSSARARPSRPTDAREETKDREKNSKESARARLAEADIVFAEWVRATDRNAAKTKLSPDRRRCIVKALASHGLSDCLAAVRNIGACPDARAGYGRGQRYDDIQHALSNAERIERWRDWTPPSLAVGNVHAFSGRRLSEAERVEAQLQALSGGSGLL